MSIPSPLSSYLEQRGTLYEVCPHPHSRTSFETARSAHVQPSQLAKSVLLEDDAGWLMALIPADKTVMVGELARQLGRKDLHLAHEDSIGMLFDECERGAIPCVGMAWGIETVVDDELEACEVVYMEGGDHERLLRLSHDQFHALMRSQPHGSFSRTPMH
ncbi:Ala-tRNA(Pro) deacylase [Polaromonas sp. OV174]|uniref:aminoacyl-tRNA deacylase n=1 Tax=Polaromonas sp. OV174 TaxID=1855300 RepID=UPI0008EAD000|nr:YbaK/EbsC family protein [Polaromonas sp. OV174]SFC68172.1 Ala-tRNA(Pro) deacylase [Polaromonas sp. OV174]